MQLACSHLRVPEPNREAIKHWFDGVPMDSPRGAEQRAVVDPHHEPTARRLARLRAICAGPARCEHRRKQANRWGRLFFGNFLLAKQKKVTAPRGTSALAANQPSPRRTSLVGINLRRAVPALRTRVHGSTSSPRTNICVSRGARAGSPAAPRMTPWRVSERKIVVNDQRRMIRELLGQINLRFFGSRCDARRGNLIVQSPPHVVGVSVAAVAPPGVLLGALV